MSKTVFISYSHKQKEWVRNNLVPCLRAGGAEVIIDHEQGKAGKAIIAQMDVQQDAADLSVLVLSPDYFNSGYCQHEMQRAITSNRFVPVLRADCAAPDEVKKVLFVDLRDDKAADKWDMLMRACGADLGATVPKWLEARDEIVRHLQNNESVNLVVPHKPGFSKPEWRGLIEHLRKDDALRLGVVDLANPITTARQALVAEMLKAIGSNVVVPPEPNDLVELGRAFEARTKPVRLALLHFDMVKQRRQYEIDLFSALRFLITEKRKLVLLIQSRQYFVELLPSNHPLSSISNLLTTELLGRQQ